ncbi:MAG: TIGR04283 family arsenosugar biosynthesis glycosyltransferase [Gammaproteobacteria bacterium]|nr:TIGR04283 family arsenosugar biosynthesis glycosyltransferase [Gammaproteobacteria bacterium]
MEPELSVIIPAINEAKSLPLLLRGLAQQREIRLEIIVADGGSDDETLICAHQHGALVARSQAGRGVQMNTAAGLARSPHLLFLHADSELTSPTQLSVALTTFKEACHRLGHRRIAGHFRLRFRRSEQRNGLAYHYYQEKSGLNRPECTNGDQGLMIAGEFFRRLGGFDESLWFLEDQRLAETVRRHGTWITLPGDLYTSARRFEQEGLSRRMILSALIMNFHNIGFLEFFHRARALYRNHDRSGPLALSPLFQLIDQLNREAGATVARQRWLATGSYVLGNSWQIFFFLDTLIGYLFGTGRHPFLATYDLVFKPICASKILAYPSAALTWLWFQSSWKYFIVRERKGLMR